MLFPGVSAVIGLAAEELVSMLSADEDAARAARASAVLVSACLAMDFVGIGLELLIPEYINIAGPIQEVNPTLQYSSVMIGCLLRPVRLLKILNL
jgi:hypothetical protein